MTRKTNLIQADGDTYNQSRKLNKTGLWAAFDAKMDKFWDWIEGTPQTDEMWRVEANGDMVLVVNEDTLNEILNDDWAKAYEDFDAHREVESDTGETVIIGLPYELCGTYTIKGVYDANQRLVDGERTYYFSQEF